METKKKPITHFFKSGEKFKFKEIDYNSSEISEEIKEIKKQQTKIRESAEVDINELKELIYTN